MIPIFISGEQDTGIGCACPNFAAGNLVGTGSEKRVVTFCCGINIAKRTWHAPAYNHLARSATNATYLRSDKQMHINQSDRRKESLNISIVGSVYVGLVAGACVAEIGHRVILVDSDGKKIAALRNGKVPIHEEFLPELITRHSGANCRC